MRFSRFLPILSWLPKYKRSYLKDDILAGVTVGIILVPQGMAYALLAGLPPIYGLYAGIVPLIIYALFGTSRQMSVGPVALVSLLVLAGVGQFAETDTELFIGLAISTALIAGVVHVLLGVFKLGFLVNFLSRPVISGLTSAAAIIIGFSQLRNLLRLDLPRSNQIYEIIRGTIQHIGEIHWLTFSIGMGGILVILALKWWKKSFPASLAVIVLSVLLVGVLGLEKQGIEIVGDVPPRLPSFGVPDLSIEMIRQLMPLALTICLVSFIESLAVAKSIEARHSDYRVVPNQELIALGIAKIAGAFFQSYPTSGSFTRSAINDEAGARTGISSMVSAAFVAATLLFFTPLFYYLPKALLAAIIVVAVSSLIDIEEAVHLWKNDRRDFLSLLVTFVATLSLGIQTGVFIGVLLSIALIIHRTSRPHHAVLGRLPDSRYYRNIHRFEEAVEHEEVVVVRFDSQLYFGNSDYFRSTIEEIVAKDEDIQALILDASGISDIDSSSLHTLRDIISFLETRDIEFYITGIIGPVRDILYKNGLTREIGTHNQFLTIHDAVKYHRTRDKRKSEGWTSDALQTNEPKIKSRLKKK